MQTDDDDDGGGGGLGGQPSPLQLSALFQLFDPGRPVAALGLGPTTGSMQASEADLCLQRLRNLMIFLAAWSCFLVKKVPLMDTTSP